MPLVLYSTRKTSTEVKLDAVIWDAIVPTGVQTWITNQSSNNPRVRVMPCGVRGEPTGEWMEGQARFAGADESQRANSLLTRKYGLMKVMFELIGKFHRRQYAAIAINI